MAGHLDTRACEACAKTKRRCGKQSPRCFRCTERGIDCLYPPSRPAMYIIYTDDNESSIRHENTTPLPVYPLGLCPTASSRNALRWDAGLPGIPKGVINGGHPSLDAWSVTFTQADIGPSNIRDMERMVACVREWLFKWIEQGSNEFIHSHLYQTRFPDYVQDAFMATSMYLHKNKSNQHTALRIIENQVKKLIGRHTFDAANSSPMWAEANSTAAKDSFEHLAQVHALLAYQIIGLYDGDIRLRRVSELNIPVLNNWMLAMINHASQSSNLNSSVILSNEQQTTRPFGETAYTDDENVQWHSWIVAESIRRTWSVVSGVQAGYLMIREGRAVAPCMGGMMFTSRLGVWEAQSATDWQNIVSAGDVGLVEMAQADKLFTQTSSEEVNDFTKMCLALTFGYERTNKWASRP